MIQRALRLAREVEDRYQTDAHDDAEGRPDWWDASLHHGATEVEPAIEPGCRDRLRHGATVAQQPAALRAHVDTTRHPRTSAISGAGAACFVSTGCDGHVGGRAGWAVLYARPTSLVGSGHDSDLRPL